MKYLRPILISSVVSGLIYLCWFAFAFTDRTPKYRYTIDFNYEYRIIRQTLNESEMNSYASQLFHRNKALKNVKIEKIDLDNFEITLVVVSDINLNPAQEKILVKTLEQTTDSFVNKHQKILSQVYDATKKDVLAASEFTNILVLLAANELNLNMENLPSSNNTEFFSFAYIKELILKNKKGYADLQKLIGILSQYEILEKAFEGQGYSIHYHLDSPSEKSSPQYEQIDKVLFYEDMYRLKYKLLAFFLVLGPIVGYSYVSLKNA